MEVENDSGTERIESDSDSESEYTSEDSFIEKFSFKSTLGRSPSDKLLKKSNSIP